MKIFFAHAAFAARVLATPLLRVRRIQASATEMCTANAAKNDTAENVATGPSVGSATANRAGMNITAEWRRRAL